MSIRLALRLSLCLIGLSMVVQADPKIDIKPDTTHIRDSLIKDKKFMKNVWKKVQKVNQEYRQYKMEKPQAVAGVRGKVQEESLSREMYYKGGERYPQRYEVEQAIEMMRGMAADSSLPITQQAEIIFYLGQCYLQLRDSTQAVQCFRRVSAEFSRSPYVSRSRQLLKDLQSE
ncbi:MAG: hypothetical protein KBA26_02590 [Candidatus Delongbacteria bacterium]|nr:hypothetical protein [Candidatus Delongbacteria bacterium]